MSVSAQLVKELRERTGVGMMQCKKALIECEGDLEAAERHLRTTGQMQADKKSSRIAAEGAILLAQTDDGSAALLMEVNSETDFVAKDENFLTFAQNCADAALASGFAEVEELMAQGFEERRQELVLKLGENIQVRRLTRIEAEGGMLGCYVHNRRIGAVVLLEADSTELGRGLAMHVAAFNPVCVSDADVPAELLESEREVLVAQAQDSGKPPEIIEKMVEGRLRKYLSGITLLGQSYVLDNDVTVGKVLKAEDASVRAFARMEVGEGMEKKQENFAEEVYAQAEKFDND